MGAGDWVSGGLRRAVAGVAALMPGGPAGAGAEMAPAPSGEAGTPVPAAQAAPAKAPATKAPATAAPATVAPATKAPATKAPAARTPAKAPATKAPGAARERDTPAAPLAAVWTAEELAGFGVALEAEIARLREELDMGEADLADLVADSGDSAGDDQADAGAKTFEREHEMSVNANTREMIDQALRARARLAAGTYGICERCGQPIAIGRLRAAPRATLCIACKQAEERR